MGLLIPIGAALTVTLRNKDDVWDERWFVWHRRLQISGALLAIGGGVVAFYFTDASKAPHFSSPHAIVGVSVLIELTFLNGRNRLAPHDVTAVLQY